MYQKEIVYMNLYENDIKGGCVGYLKLERKQENYHIELQVKNVPNKFAGTFPIRIQGENDWKEPDVLSIKDGYGKWGGTMAEPIMRAEVLLTDACRIKGESKKKVQTTNHEQTDNYVQTVDHVQTDNNVQTVRQSKEEKQPDSNLQAVKEEMQPDNKKDLQQASETENAHIDETERVQDTQSPDTPLYESKWEQLLATYEQIHPYGDNRVYVKLEPKDFIILRSNYQHLVNNSFLLHGFYNYRYLILGKESDFYIGVPGVFYEREKMVALMFGFEAFECEGGDAEEGKFGYYLRKVEI